jgi:hypothetical protein
MSTKLEVCQATAKSRRRDQQPDLRGNRAEGGIDTGPSVGHRPAMAGLMSSSPIRPRAVDGEANPSAPPCAAGGDDSNNHAGSSTLIEISLAPVPACTQSLSGVSEPSPRAAGP